MKYSLASNTIVGVIAASNIMRTASTPSSSAESQKCLAPETKQLYPVLKNTQVSSDSHILTVALPENREYLGWNSDIPTCIAVSFYNDLEEKGVLAKSYSPISHPNQPDWFQLLVKAYPCQKGGGVGSYICGLKEGDMLEAKVKNQRIMHSSPNVLGRWKHVGLVAGGTGIAPLYQILIMLLKDDASCKIHVLSIHRRKEDILMKSELDQIALDYPDQVSVTYSLTGSNDDDDDGEPIGNCQQGRGSKELARQALPDPSLDDVMVLVCGKDGFVEHWGGKVGRAPPKPDGSKGPKIQAELLGVLKDAGFSASQVFKY